MASAPPGGTRDIRMDGNSLYREEIYTDRASATMRVLVPVTKTGDPDTARPTLYLGEVQLMTNMGPLPISFEIEATSLAEAVDKYGDSAKAGVENAMRELQEMRRQASSSLVLPQGGMGGMGGMGGLGGPGGGLGGGKIQLP